MSKPPKELWWVDAKMRDTWEMYAVNRELPWGQRTARKTAGVKGGKVSSYEAAVTRRTAILAYDPQAQVRIYKTVTNWEEVE